MDQDRWARTRELFDQARSRKPDERREFLKSACGEDADLRREVESLLALGEAVEKLKKIRPRAAEVVKCRYFDGLTADQTAAALEISFGAVESDWRFARAWLHRELGEGGTTDTGTDAGVRTDGPGAMGENPGTLR